MSSSEQERVRDTGARIYENLLPCLMLRGILIPSKNFEKITANEKNETFDNSDS